MISLKDLNTDSVVVDFGNNISVTFWCTDITVSKYGTVFIHSDLESGWNPDAGIDYKDIVKLEYHVIRDGEHFYDDITNMLVDEYNLARGSR